MTRDVFISNPQKKHHLKSTGKVKKEKKFYNTNCPMSFVRNFGKNFHPIMFITFKYHSQCHMLCLQL